MQEEWKAVPGYEGIYEISREGRVRRLARITDHGQDRREMTRRLGNKPRSNAPVERHLAPRELIGSMLNGYRVVYLNQGNQKSRALYIDSTVKKLFGITDNFVPLPNEEWRPVIGYETFYEVSNIGRVRSLGKMAPDGRYIRPRLLDIGRASGYPKCELIRDGASKMALIHRLVAQAFIPNPLELDCVHHKDEDKTNNRANNLEWTTRAENIRDWFRRRDGDVIKRVATALGISEVEARKVIFDRE